jgi:site-specific DNA recombinase
MKAVPNEFRKFAKNNAKQTKVSSGVNCVIYTRVSTKEQADNNLSLQTQKKACVQYAEKQSYC